MNDSTNRCSLGWKKLKREIRLGPDELILLSFILLLERLPHTNTGISDFCDLLDQGLPVRDASGQTVDSEILKQSLLRAKETADNSKSPPFIEQSKMTLDELSRAGPDDWHYWMDKETLLYEVRRVDVARIYAALHETEFPWRDYMDELVWLNVAEDTGEPSPKPAEPQEEPQPKRHKLTGSRAVALSDKRNLTLVDMLDLLGLAKPEHFWDFQYCEFDETGIRAKPLDEQDKRFQSGTEYRTWKDFEQDIRLALPCSPHTFLTWCSRNQFTDVLPPAFVTAMLNQYRSAVFTPLQEDYEEALRQNAWTAWKHCAG